MAKGAGNIGRRGKTLILSLAFHPCSFTGKFSFLDFMYLFI